ncbi:MAG TPA: bifunctional phosphoribosylaminoimidazolecarboxamide formyltransferase/IMP cyclohydrolase [bacterium]|nr:bifunctional phosphoribosylaminoimidazolecarboxamide formyltransferase/IMP cyclohydrolase [bacterium]
MRKVSCALISVYDKSDIVELATFLSKKGVDIIATSGTQKILEKAGIKTVDLSTLTGSSELLGGEIKTLYPVIYASVMANPEDPQELENLQNMGGRVIDLLVINPLPLVSPEQPIKGKQPKTDTTIDIGCTTLIRAAARNHSNVTILTNPSQYDEFMGAFDETDGKISVNMRKKLAHKAYEMVADYDISLFEHFFKKDIETDDFLSETLFLKYRKSVPLRYGENPHQKSAFYSRPEIEGVTMDDLEQLHGPDLSYNNFNDLNSAIEIAMEFEKTVAVVVKHGNPVGVAVDKEPLQAYLAARESDKVSSFGAVVAFTCQVDKKTARELETAFTEVLIAPKYTDGALNLLKSSKKTANMRIFQISDKKWNKPVGTLDIKSVLGGVMIQNKDDFLVPDDGQIKVVSKRKPTRKQLADLVLAWKVCKYVRSNAIVIVKDGRTLGIGAGQMSRMDSLKIALEKAGEEAVGAVLASDAYFPFRNVADETAKFGISAIIEPGGARRDDEIIMACDEHNIALCLTGMRHFRH